MTISTAPSYLLFHGATYRKAIQVGHGSTMMTDDEVANVLAQQYHNRGRVTAEVLKARWVKSPWFLLTAVYPGMPELGISPGKEGDSFSLGQPLVIDKDISGISAQNPDGSYPDYLVLDGQNRMVRLRRGSPFRLYPAYVGIRILDGVEQAVAAFAARLQKARRPAHPPSADELL